MYYISLLALFSSIDKPPIMGYTTEYQATGRGYMKFVSVKDFRTAAADVWKKLSSEREIVVTNNGKPFALIIPLNDEMLEVTVTAIRRVKALNALKKMQEISASLGNDKMTIDDINAIIRSKKEK